MKPELERFLATDWNGNANRAASLGINVIAAVDALQRPSMSLQHSGEFLAGVCLHSASSTT